MNMDEKSSNVNACRSVAAKHLQRILQFATFVSLAVFLPRVAHADETGMKCAAAAERAQQDRDAGKLLDARTGFAQCASDVCPLVVRKECEIWKTETNASVPRLRVRIRGAGRLFVDGQPVPPAEASEPILLDPGSHTVSLQDGERRDERRIVLTLGREVAVSLALPTGTGQPVGPVQAEQPRSSLSWRFWAGSAAAATSLAVATGFGVSALTDYNRLSTTCPGCTQADIDGMHTKAIVADIALVVGVVALAYTGWVLFHREPTRQAAVLQF
jgi:hypothetical protein